MITFILAAATAAAAAQFTLFKVDPSTGGICLDGTPGAFYFKPGNESTKWMFHLEGGGWCYEPGDCYGRSLTDLGSSKNYPSNITTAGGGMLDTDCGNNPQFCNWNIVFMRYCDGNSFSGQRPEPLMWNGTALHMRGHFILQAVFTMILNNGIAAPTPYSAATDVVLSGCSAGGLAAILHTDYVADNYVPSGAKFWSVPISGFFLDAPNVNGERVYTEQMQTVWAMQQPGGDGVNAACVAANPGNEWKCNMAEYTYQHIRSPIFPLNSGYDSWQTTCILASEPVNPANWTNHDYNCSAVPGWSVCADAPEACTNKQILAYNNFYDEFIMAMNSTITAGNGQNGAFINSCSTHCEALYANWYNTKVNGVTMRDAVAAWMAGTNPTPHANFYWDCFYNADSTPRNCNPTC